MVGRLASAAADVLVPSTRMRGATRFGVVRTAGIAPGRSERLAASGVPMVGVAQAAGYAVPAPGAACDPQHFRSFGRYGANAERAYPTDHDWYLVVVGVHPEVQRQAIGSRLLQLR